jgi:hypothetical protein
VRVDSDWWQDAARMIDPLIESRNIPEWATTGLSMNSSLDINRRRKLERVAHTVQSCVGSSFRAVVGIVDWVSC